jgi:penicillin amidase
LSLRRSIRVGFGIVVVVVVAAAAVGWHLHRRALPVISGRVRVPGLKARVEIVRDRWGVPHIFAASERDAYFGLGYAAAQDRLFQMELHRRIGQGRLSELFGPAALPADRLFRTVDLQGIGRRQLAAAPPEVQEAFAAYAEGVNASVSTLHGRLPIEFTLLGQTFAPAAADDFVGIIGYMAWTLNLAWEMDPLYQQLVERVGEDKARRLFPYDRGGHPAVHEAPAAVPVAFDPVPAPAPALDLAALMGISSGLAGSNTWVVAPSHSTSGHALLANDPHLTHGLPSLWYEAHLQAPGFEVAGMTLPGAPFVIIGHNRRIAWGLTNVMMDAGDFFREHLEGTPPRRVESRGQWVDLRRRTERIRVKGGPDVTMEVLETPHGPLVNHLLETQTEPLSYSWVHAQAAGEVNEMDAMYRIDHATDWASFRAGAARLGAVAQNASYADVDGHIGLQTTGRIPRRHGRWDGNGFRKGWDGSDDWEGFVPFEQLPSSFDPPAGWLVASNNPTWPEPLPYFISSHWEPLDRATRIRARLAEKPKLSLDDLRAIQADVTVPSWPPLREALRAAFGTAPPSPGAPPSGPTRAALDRVLAWDGTMAADNPAAAVFGAFFEHLYREIFADEMGEAVLKGYRAKGNLWAIMTQASLDGAAVFMDDLRTPEVESKDVILRRAFEAAVQELRSCCGDDPGRWQWGQRHTFELKHPLAAGGRLLRDYFNRGPWPVGGHALTVNKAEFAGGGYSVAGSPSMRLLVDMGRVAEARSVLPAGESGIPASRHYDDQAALWRRVEDHSFFMDRAAIDAVAEGTLVLEP